jgi:hypothetical protein
MLDRSRPPEQPLFNPWHSSLRTASVGTRSRVITGPWGKAKTRGRPLHSRQPFWTRLSRRPTTLWFAAGLIGTIGLVGYELCFRALGCTVKGNISPAGERIYHVPGQDFYAHTAINWLWGERWFCSEEAARQAGWRRARV